MFGVGIGVGVVDERHFRGCVVWMVVDTDMELRALRRRVVADIRYGQVGHGMV